MLHRLGFAGLLAISLCLATAVLAQTSKPATRSDAWSDMDQRLVFFAVQLASVESSIDATNKQLKAAGYKITVRTDDAARFQKGNELMDRNAGGPVRWQDFYGRTAESFFYNPAPRPGELRLTATVLRAYGDGGTMPKPADQRPPQFDYIYRANDNAKAQAEADIAKLAGKVDQLLARRRQLEMEQSGLWTKLAFRAVAGRELLGKPLYRFDLKSDDQLPPIAQRLEAMRAAMDFLRTSNRLIELADKGVDANQDGFVKVFEDTVLKTRAEFDIRVNKQPMLVMDANERSTTLGKLCAVAKRMNDVAKNVGDAYKWSLDGDKAGDEQRKQTFRAQLQEGLITYAEAVAAGDECVSALAKEWKVTPDLEKMIEAPKPLEVPDAPKAEAKVPEAFTLAPYGQPGTDSRPTKPAGKDGDQTGRTPEKGDRARSSNLLASVDLKKGALSGNWAKDGESVTCQPDNPARLVLPAAPKSDEYDLRIEFTRHSGNQGFGACLTSGNRTFLLQVSAVDNQYVAVTDFKDVAKDDWARRNLKYPMPTGKRQVMVIHVRKDGVRADLDGKEFYAYATDFSNHVRNEWGFRPRTLGLVSWLNVVTFYSVELVEGDALNAAAELPARCRIVNKASGKVLSIPNQNRGNSVELVAAGREVSQEWEILSIGRGRVRLCNRLADTCLGVRGESLKPDTDILNWIGRDAPAKAKAEGADWVIEDTGDGYVRIRNALSGLYFAAERDRGFQKDRAAAESQLWKLESLDAKLPEPAAEPKQPSLAGDWLLSSITNFHMTITLREDGTIGRPDGLKGRWTLGGDKLVADYGVIVDTFSGHDGDAWVGTNSEGTKIRLDRGKADAAPTRVFKSINEIVAAVPADVIPAKGRPWTTVKADAANVVISQNLDGQAFRVQVKVVDLPKWDGKGMLYSAVDLPQGFPIRIFAHFDDQERAKLGSLNIGDSVLLTGTFMRGQNQVLNLWNSWGFSVNLEKCSVDKIR